MKVSLITNVPFAGVFYPVYNFFKEHYSAMLIGTSGTVRLAYVTSLASFSANMVSCTLTHPVDLIRTRIFFQYHNADTSQHYKGITDAVAKIYATDGVKGYFTGLGPRMARKSMQ